MEFIDISQSERIPILMEMVSALSRVAEPAELLELCIGGMRRIYGSRCYVEISTRGLSPGEYRLMRLLGSDGVDHVAPLSRLDSSDLPAVRGGVIGQVIASPTPRLAQHVSIGPDPVTGVYLCEYHSLMAAPIFSGGEAAHWIIILDTKPEGLALADFEELILRANLVGAATSNLQIARQLIGANLRIQQEMDHIASIQRALLPATMPQIPGCSLAASYESFDQAGGDFDRLPTPDKGT